MLCCAHLIPYNYWANIWFPRGCGQWYLGLGWWTIPIAKAKNVTCGCYTKPLKVPHCLSTTTSPTSFPTLINPSWHSWSQVCQRCATQVVTTSPPPCTNMVIQVNDATNGDVGWMGGKIYAKCVGSTKTKLKTHVK